MVEFIDIIICHFILEVLLYKMMDKKTLWVNVLLSKNISYEALLLSLNKTNKKLVLKLNKDNNVIAIKTQVNFFSHNAACFKYCITIDERFLFDFAHPCKKKQE